MTFNKFGQTTAVRERLAYGVSPTEVPSPPHHFQMETCIGCRYHTWSPLEEVSAAKYLGLTLQNNLSWNSHVDNIATKANNTRAFLQRNLQQCRKKTEELCYMTLIRPIMEYASVVWDPFTEDNIRKLEMVQRREVCMVYADYRLTSSVTSMLQQLQWSTLQEWLSWYTRLSTTLRMYQQANWYQLYQ